jgi:hypothetical protein
MVVDHQQLSQQASDCAASWPLAATQPIDVIQQCRVTSMGSDLRMGHGMSAGTETVQLCPDENDMPSDVVPRPTHGSIAEQGATSPGCGSY